MSKNMLWSEIFGSKKCFGSEKNCVGKIILYPKKLSIQKNFREKIMLVQKMFFLAILTRYKVLLNSINFVTLPLLSNKLKFEIS